MIGIHSIKATFVGTESDWQEVISHLSIGLGSDRRIGDAILAGVERQGGKWFGQLSPGEKAKYRSEMTFALRFTGGTVQRLRDIIREMDHEE